VNIDAPEQVDQEPRLLPKFRVLQIQTRLHRWATDDPGRRFDDLYNLVCDPGVLAEAWRRVRGNKGGRSAGVDGHTAYAVEAGRGADRFLSDLRADLKARRFQPLPVRERMIPKTGGKLRRLGIPTVRDRVAQAALKLVLEPIFEADFHPCSYGFRPKRRAQDAIAEIHFLSSRPRNYEWVLEGDIEACFDNIDHTALMGRVRRRIGDKRVLGLVKAFLKAGVLTEGGDHEDTTTGTPQGGILSPLLANIALSVLDDHFTEAWQSWGNNVDRARRRRHGLPTYRLVRYADDFVIMVKGTRGDTETLRDDVAAALEPMGLRLSDTKTRVTHIDEGLDFLGFHIQRRTKRGTAKRYVYFTPSKKALAAIKAKVKALTRGGTDLPLAVVLHRLTPVLRGWTNYFRHVVSKATFGYLDHYTWHRVVTWLRHKHRRTSWKQIRRRYLPGWQPTDGTATLFRPAQVAVTRYPYRGTQIPTPWSRNQEPVT
jgi:RNA-directed DNA polymerase